MSKFAVFVFLCVCIFCVGCPSGGGGYIPPDPGEGEGEGEGEIPPKEEIVSIYDYWNMFEVCSVFCRERTIRYGSWKLEILDSYMDGNTKCAILHVDNRGENYSFLYTENGYIMRCAFNRATGEIDENTIEQWIPERITLGKEILFEKELVTPSIKGDILYIGEYKFKKGCGYIECCN